MLHLLFTFIYIHQRVTATVPFFFQAVNYCSISSLFRLELFVQLEMPECYIRSVSVCLWRQESLSRLQ